MYRFHENCLYGQMSSHGRIYVTRRYEIKYKNPLIILPPGKPELVHLIIESCIVLVQIQVGRQEDLPVTLKRDVASTTELSTSDPKCPTKAEDTKAVP